MNESTARADRFDLQTSTSSFYRWEVPQKAVAVRIPYPLIDRLEREAVESFRSVTSRGSEIGGLLIGEVTPGTPMLVSVADYQLIDCEYARGPLYRLSDADLVRFQQAIQQRGSAGVAGYFRTHTRKGITLDADDLSLLDALFGEPHQFALLIRPFATKASTGAIFLREGGAFNCEPSCLEFPFHPPAVEAKGPAPGQEVKPPAAPVPAPPPARPTARAQIVPIASRREISLLGGTVEERPAEAPAPRPEIQAEPVPEGKAEPKAEPKPETKVEEAAPPASRPEPVAETKAAALAREPEPPSFGASAAPALSMEVPAAGSGKALKLVLAALAATVLFVVLFVYPGLMRNSGKAPAPPQADTSPLQLRVERSNGALLLTWNRDSDAVKSATKAVLTINDGAQHENVDMDLAQLRNGSIVYSPQTADISFQMEVTGKDAAKTTSESVRVLRTRPSPLDTPAQTAAAATPPPAATAPAPGAQSPAPAGAETATPAGETEAPAEEVSKPVTATRAFNPASLSARLRPAQASDLPDAPTVAGAAPAIPRVNLGNVTAVPQAPAAAPAPPTAASSAPQSGGKIQQAVLIFKKDPEYPKLAQQTGAHGTVKLSATIGKDGKVKSVRVISGHPMLQTAAVAAVKQWLYRPTLLNGQPVETDTEIVLNFLAR